MARPSSDTLSALTNRLVDCLAPSLDDHQKSYAAEYCLREVQDDVKGGTRREWVDVVGALHRAERSARVRVQDGLGDALQRCKGDLDRHRRGVTGWEGDMPIKMSNLPQHIQLLLNLSSAPTAATHRFAQTYLAPQAQNGPTPDQQLYAEIMDEPFTGDHWGRGHDEEVYEGWTDSSESDSQSGTSAEEDERIVTPLTGRLLDRKELARREMEEKVRAAEERLRVAERSLERLKEGYWRTEGVELEEMQEGVFGWREVMTRVSTASLAAKLGGEQVKVISAEQLQRDMLFGLSGREGVIFTFSDVGTCAIKDGHPQVKHFSPLSMAGILDTVAGIATSLAQLRHFVSDVLLRPSTSTSRRSRTQEAFAEGCRAFLQEVDTWISNVETACIRGTSSNDFIPSTPTSLINVFQEKYASRLDLFAALQPLSAHPATLLDAIHAAYEAAIPPSNRRHTLDLFVRSATPIWSSLRSWLADGMPLPSSLLDIDEINLSLDGDERDLDPEFFIKRDRDVSWTDEDFWEAGYIVNDHDSDAAGDEGRDEGEGGDGWPKWMGGTMDQVLEAGKARGLLKGLLGEAGTQETTEWKSLRQVCADLHRNGTSIAAAVEGFLDPLCQIAIFQLRRVLDEECGLNQHLEAIEGVLFARGHDSIDRFWSGLYDQIREGRKWNDMQSLTSGMRDAIDQTGETWLNPTVIRLSPGSQKGKSKGKDRERERGARDVLNMLGGLRIAYAVPFPLSVLFTSNPMNLRSRVFGFLTQVEYARRSCTSASGRARVGDVDVKEGGWALRYRLGWFVNTLWTWITQRVVEVQSGVYRARLGEMSSLKGMIALEMQYARRIRDFCFLHDHTAEVYDDIFAILEMAVEIGSSSMIKTGDNRGKNLEEGNTVNTVDDTPSLSRAAGGDGAVRSKQALLVELDDRVLAIRQAVEVLSTEGGISAEDEERREIWGMLSFALEDWR